MSLHAISLEFYEENDMTYFRCIKGLLRAKAVLLVTHQLHYMDQVDRVLILETVGYLFITIVGF